MPDPLVPKSERWIVMSRTSREGYGWLTVIDGPQVGEDGETFEVMRAEVTDEMVERATEAWRANFEYGDDAVGIRAALLAAFSTTRESDDGRS